MILTAQSSARSRQNRYKHLMARMEGDFARADGESPGFHIDAWHLESPGFGILKVYWSIYAIATWKENREAGKVVKPILPFHVWRTTRHHKSSIIVEDHRGGRSKRT